MNNQSHAKAQRRKGANILSVLAALREIKKASQIEMIKNGGYGLSLALIDGTWVIEWD